MWPWPLTFEPQNRTTSRVSQDHSLHQVGTLWDHTFLSYAADNQTNRQTDRLENPTYADRPTWVITLRARHLVAYRCNVLSNTLPLWCDTRQSVWRAYDRPNWHSLTPQFHVALLSHVCAFIIVSSFVIRCFDDGVTLSLNNNFVLVSCYLSKALFSSVI